MIDTEVPQDDNRGEITILLAAWQAGDHEALDRLSEKVHVELRRIAAAYIVREQPGHLLQPSAVINELWLRFIGEDGIDWSNRAHFYAIAARRMRQLLVDYARKRLTKKRGGDAIHVELGDAPDLQGERAVEYVALDEALRALAQWDASKAQLIELRYYGGLTIRECAVVMKTSSSTVKRELKFCKAWLAAELEGGQQ